MTLSKIRILNEQTINKIAAGEVIENPASVVKELVENALDAGATHICVEIKEGGRQLIRVSDDGCGMSHDDALLCLERHATSKIREVEDIQELFTMGFRGEAIPSIAAISKLTLLTCLRAEGGNAAEGTLIRVEGGTILTCTHAVRTPGTTFEVKSLFFNVPVRRKFQKSPTFDTQEILKILGFFALGHPSIQFELISDQKTLLKTPTSPPLLPQELLKMRLPMILGQDFATAVLPLTFNQPPYEIEGYIGRWSAHKPNRTGQHLFINQRLVSSPLIAAAVREGYGTMLPTHRYPLFVLYVRMPGDLLDVNVHPQKQEVRLLQERQLKEIIIQAVQQTLYGEQRPLASLPVEEEPRSSPFLKPYATLVSYPSPPRVSAANEEKWEFKPVTSPSSFSVQEAPTPFMAPSLALTPSLPRVLATLVGYCLIDPFGLDSKLFEGAANKPEGGLALVDQKAAYARVYYEQLLKQQTTDTFVQPLLIPLTLHFNAAEATLIHLYLTTLNQVGFAIREFGEHSFIVEAFPSFIKQEQLQTCLITLIEELKEGQTTRHLQNKKEEQVALVICRTSLPATKRLDLATAQGLIQQLMQCERPAQCPLGKPTCLYLAPQELAKIFSNK